MLLRVQITPAQSGRGLSYDVQPFRPMRANKTNFRFPLISRQVGIQKRLNKEKSKIYHLCHNDNQAGLSHERRLAAHVRPGDKHACALTIDR